MSIDLTDDNQYLVTVQVVNPGEVASKQAKGAQSSVTTFAEKAESMSEALRKMTTLAPRKIYLSHLRILVLSEQLAKQGIGKSLEFLSRDHELRTDFYIVVAKKVKAESILKALTSIEKIPSQKLFSSLEVSEKTWAPTKGVHIDELINDMLSDGKSPVLTGIVLTGDIGVGQQMKNIQQVDLPTRLKLVGLGVFKKDKLMGWLNEEESKGYNYITGKVKTTMGSSPCPKGGDLVLEVVRSKPDIKGKVINGKPVITVNVFTEANVAEVSCSVDLTKPQSIEQLEKLAGKSNEEIIRSSIKKAQQLKADIFGFGEEIHRADPTAWKELKQNWDEEFPNMKITIHSEFKIRRTGTVSKSFLEKLKE